MIISFIFFSFCSKMDIVRWGRMGLFEKFKKIFKKEEKVDLETYDKAMAEFERRSKTPYRGTPGHLLTGLVTCGYCGAKMRYQKWTKDGQYKLNCYSHDSSKPHLVKDPLCPSTAVWAEEVENAVLKDLWSIPYQVPEETAEDISSILMTNLKDTESRLSKKLKRLYELYSVFEADDDGEDLVLLESISETRAAIEKIRTEISAEEKNGQLTARRKIIDSHITETEQLWDFMTFDEKRLFIKSIINSITITDNQINIDYDI